MMRGGNFGIGGMGWTCRLGNAKKRTALAEPAGSRRRRHVILDNKLHFRRFIVQSQADIR